MKTVPVVTAVEPPPGNQLPVPEAPIPDRFAPALLKTTLVGTIRRVPAEPGMQCRVAADFAGQIGDHPFSAFRQRSGDLPEQVAPGTAARAGISVDDLIGSAVKAPVLPEREDQVVGGAPVEVVQKTGQVERIDLLIPRKFRQVMHHQTALPGQP